MSETPFEVDPADAAEQHRDVVAPGRRDDGPDEPPLEADPVDVADQSDELPEDDEDTPG